MELSLEIGRECSYRAFHGRDVVRLDCDEGFALGRDDVVLHPAGDRRDLDIPGLHSLSQQSTQKHDGIAAFEMDVEFAVAAQQPADVD